MHLVALFLAALLVTSSASAASKPPVHRPSPSEIDSLFAALARAESEEEAKPIEEKILTAFLHSGSPTVDLLMSRAGAALQAGDAATGQKLIASITGIAPEYAE